MPNNQPPDSELDNIDTEDELHIPDDKGQEHTIARRLALQILYEVDTTGHPHGQAIATHLGRYALQALTTDYTVQLVNGVLGTRSRLNKVIEANAPDWPLDQMAVVDRNILRIAIYEYHFIGGLPVGVVIKEAIHLAGLFAADSTVSFINGVLGNIFRHPEQLQATLNSHTIDEEDEG